MKSKTTSAYENTHLDIPGNPSTAKSSTLSLNQRENAEPLNCLTEQQWQHWITQGYVVVKAAISKEQANATANFLWEFEEKNPADSTWYTACRNENERTCRTGMVEVYNHQQLWNNRQSEKVYKAFTDVWGTEKLWVTIDRANLNFPISLVLNTKVLFTGIMTLKQNPKTCKEC